jgi:hypothetical protein
LLGLAMPTQCGCFLAHQSPCFVLCSVGFNGNMAMEFPHERGFSGTDG